MAHRGQVEEHVQLVLAAVLLGQWVTILAVGLNPPENPSYKNTHSRVPPDWECLGMGPGNLHFDKHLGGLCAHQSVDSR